MKQLVDTLNQIKTFRARYGASVVMQDPEAESRLSHALVLLQSALVDELDRVLRSGGATTMKHILVFSDEFPDGRIMDEFQYRQFTRSLVENDQWSDLRTHRAVEIDFDLVSEVERILFSGRENRHKVS